MKFLSFIILTLSACSSDRGRPLDEIPRHKLSCDERYNLCIRLKFPKKACDKEFDDCDLGNYNLEVDPD